MKVKKRIMIALAGAMILGVFGTSGAPMMASESQDPLFMITIPADLTITQPGWNKAGTISMSVYQPGTIFLKTDEAQDDQGYRYLVNTKDESLKIPYRLSGTDEEYYGQYSINKDEQDFPLVDQDTFSFLIGASIEEEDYSNMPPGEYMDTVTFEARFQKYIEPQR